jgi:hypothetical protein
MAKIYVWEVKTGARNVLAGLIYSYKVVSPGTIRKYINGEFAPCYIAEDKSGKFIFLLLVCWE